MSTLVDQLAKYADYHRNHRNVTTHMIGIPLIVVAIAILLSRPMIATGSLVLTPAMIVLPLSALYYLRIDLQFGLVMAALLALCLLIGLNVARLPTAIWLSMGLGIFVFGWMLQFIGHYYEGRKPAFFDDVRGLIIGPLFVLAEAAFAFGLRREVRDAIATRLARR